MNNHILILGSDSFIAQKFISQYSDKYCIANISRVKTDTADEYIITDFSEVSIDFFDTVEVVLNFAAIVHRPDIKDEKIYDEVNHQLAILNAQKAKQAGVKLFIQMSTIAVYGNASDISIDTPCSPQNAYGRSKLKADEELLAMQDDIFKVAIIRPPMVYGGGKAPGNMMRLIGLADKRIPLPFKGIDNSRDFINVNNLIQYLYIVAEKQLSGIHLISDQEPVSTEYLLSTISKYLGKKVPLIKIPEWFLKLLRLIRPNEFDKLYGTLRVYPNFPYEKLINRFTVEHGMSEMVESFIKSKQL